MSIFTVQDVLSLETALHSGMRRREVKKEEYLALETTSLEWEFSSIPSKTISTQTRFLQYLYVDYFSHNYLAVADADGKAAVIRLVKRLAHDLTLPYL